MWPCLNYSHSLQKESNGGHLHFSTVCFKCARCSFYTSYGVKLTESRSEEISNKGIGMYLESHGHCAYGSYHVSDTLREGSVCTADNTT